jgi:alkyldihydroxyacetonephosphate synthase
MLLGSEGILGVITDAWVRVRPRPEWKAAATVRFERFGEACEAVREIVQAGLDPANCRLLEAAEAEMTGAGDGSAHLLLLAFESAHHPVEAPLRIALAAAEDHKGEADDPRITEPDADAAQAGGAADSWRGAFLLAPYLRDTFVACGVLSETFETAITWDRLEEFHATVMETTRRAIAEVSGAPTEGRGAPLVSCRFTHAYPDGVAPYFTVLAPAIRGGEVEQWDEVKAAVSEALIEGGGTITHHHAVGRDHRPWYDRQRPAPFAAALRAAKAELDPAGILNPGVLLDP